MLPGEVFVLQWYQAQSQAAPEMPHVFWLWPTQVGVGLRWVGEGSLVLAFFLNTVPRKVLRLSRLHPQSLCITDALGLCMWTGLPHDMFLAYQEVTNNMWGTREDEDSVGRQEWGGAPRKTSWKGKFKL